MNKDSDDSALHAIQKGKGGGGTKTKRCTYVCGFNVLYIISANTINGYWVNVNLIASMFLDKVWFPAYALHMYCKISAYMCMCVC